MSVAHLHPEDDIISPSMHPNGIGINPGNSRGIPKKNFHRHYSGTGTTRLQWWSAIIEFFGFFRFYFFNFFRTSFCVLHWKFPRVAATEYCGKKPKNSIIADHHLLLPSSTRGQNRQIRQNPNPRGESLNFKKKGIPAF